MGNRVYLNIDTNEGILFIPFVGLEELDIFTMGYENIEELVNSLNRMLDLSISIDEVKNIYISGDMYKKNDKGSLSHIKYSGDNFDLDTLKTMFSLYLKQDRRRVMRNDIRNIITSGMVNFKGGKSVSDKDIDEAVSIYFDKDYKNQRDAYFLIKGFARLCITDGKKAGSLEKIEELSNGNKDNHVDRLSKLESKDDDYFQYLLELAFSDREQFERVIDELSKTSLEELSRVFNVKNSGIFDGVSSSKLESSDDEEDLYVLKYCTGMSIEELKDLVYEFRNESLFRRSR